MCSDDIQALGALDAVRDEKKLVGHDVMIFGFDCSSESLREAASGSIVNTFSATLWNSPRRCPRLRSRCSEVTAPRFAAAASM